jgi:hypothetical protein
MRRRVGLAVLLVLVGASRGLASDGVVEINQASALAGGVTPGDGAGFPVTISAPGSFRLTGDLLVPDENTDGIVIGAPNVDIDLNGFEVVRAGCPRVTTNCTPASGTGTGIDRTGADLVGISVRNGGVVGMGSFGIQLESHAHVQGVRVRWNRFTGIVVGTDSIVSGNLVLENGQDGISAPRSVISGNVVSDNGGAGIVANSSALISENLVYSNGETGIACFEGSTARGNVVRENSGFGLSLDPESSFRENTITGNLAGTVTGGGVSTGNNLCNGSTTCP